MAVDSDALSAKYNVLSLSVISSTAISNRTSALIQHLKSPASDSKPTLVALHAKAQVANKLISIVEIAKRDLKESDRKIFQYNALGSELIESKPSENRSLSEDEDAFEPMNQKPTVRNMPTMTTYLSLSSIKELKDAYGYVEWKSSITLLLMQL